jgi:hypothetical protein
MKYLFIFFILLSNLINVYSQNESISEIYKYKNYNGFNYNYALEHENELLRNNYNIYNKYKITEQVYNTIDFEIYSKTPGFFCFYDTLFFPDNLNFDDGNYIITEALSNTYNSIFKSNVYGFYLVNVRNEFSYFSDILFPLKINVKDKYIILSTESDLNFISNQGGFFYSDLRTSNYNNKYFAYQSNKNSFNEKKRLKFKNVLAYQQLIMFGSLNETRIRLNDYFKSLIQEISRIKSVMKID